MKSTLIKGLAPLFIALLFVQASPIQQSEEPTGIAFFEGSWEEALAKAKKEDKLIFLDAYASWCGPCKLMKRNTFPNEVVGQMFNDNFINYEMDMEKGIGPKLSAKYGIRAYPTLLFINGNGEIVHQGMGYQQPKQLIMLGQGAIAKTAP